jgi:hypothetical protein
LTSLRLVRGSNRCPNIHWALLSGLLRAAPALQLLQLARLKITHFFPEQTIVLPHLRTLLIDLPDMTTTQAVTGLHLPAIITIDIHFSVIDIHGGFEGSTLIDTFVQQSTMLSHAMHVHLWTGDISRKSAEQLLASLAATVTLHVTCGNVFGE